MIYRPYLKIEFVKMKMVIFKINKCKNLFVYFIIFYSCLILFYCQWLCWTKTRRLPLNTMPVHQTCLTTVILILNFIGMVNVYLANCVLFLMQRDFLSSLFIPQNWVANATDSLLTHLLLIPKTLL